jgi:hypothetical protein
MNLTMEQISVSTADEERNYFSGSVKPEAPTQSGSAMPTGTYRVVDGMLYLILPSAPAFSQPPSAERDHADS